MSHHIIRKIRLAHCKRGPSICEKCREMDVEKICLLDISPPGAGEFQRRVIQVNVGGEEVWREFDVVRAFESEAEAKAYAEANGINDAEF
jgi:predicted Fe-Mo cluster-binding NifX family protein